MTELDIYGRFRDMSIAHSNPVEWLECHGFGVGYMDMLNTNNLDQSDYRKTYFYSEKWYNEGMNPNSTPLDFPFILMLPVAGDGGILKKGGTEQEIFTMVFYVTDLMFQDRMGHKDNDYAKRTREEIFAHTHQIGQQILMEFFAKVNGVESKFQPVGEYHFEKVYDITNRRIAGTMFEQKVKLAGTCTVGTFDYGKEFTERKEKFTGV